MDQAVIEVLKNEESGRTKIEAGQKVIQARAEEETLGLQKENVTLSSLGSGKSRRVSGDRGMGRPHAEGHVAGGFVCRREEP